MNVTVDRNALDGALAIISAVVPSRTPKPILQCVRVTADTNGVRLTATDDTLGIRYAVPQAQVTEPGDVLLAADILAQIVRASVDNTLLLETEGTSCHVRGRDSHFEIYSQDPREFPPVASLEGSADFELSAGLLAELVTRTVYAAARENTRYAINGILWEKRDNKLHLVGTDGRRLALAAASLEKGVGPDQRAILPVRTLRIALRLLGDSESVVRARLTENQFLMQVDGAHLSSVLVEGNFPRYQDVIPTDVGIKLELPTQELSSAVRRAALLTDDDSKGVRFTFQEGELVLSSRAPKHGEATIRMPIDYSGETLEIGFNPAYVTDALNVAGQESVTVELKEASRPGILRVGSAFTYVVMPVSL